MKSRAAEKAKRRGEYLRGIVGICLLFCDYIQSTLKFGILQSQNWKKVLLNLLGYSAKARTAAHTLISQFI